VKSPSRSVVLLSCLGRALFLRASDFDLVFIQSSFALGKIKDAWFGHV
jgi:hypothetical protein